MLTARRFTAGPESPIKGVSAAAWQRFLAALDVQAAGAVSPSGGLGSYDLRPRRLVELGYATGLQSTKTRAGRQINTCIFRLPWTQARFLADSLAQYVALAKSVALYHQALMRGDLAMRPGVSMAGMLAILHVGGRGALQSWPELFTNTKALLERAKGAF